MKKFRAVVLCIFLAVFLASCGEQGVYFGGDDDGTAALSIHGQYV